MSIHGTSVKVPDLSDMVDFVTPRVCTVIALVLMVSACKFDEVPLIDAGIESDATDALEEDSAVHGVAPSTVRTENVSA